LLTSNCADVKLIGLVTVAMLKVIVDPSHASAIAWRRLPAPLSRLLATTGSVVQPPCALDGESVRAMTKTIAAKRPIEMTTRARK
jgi:hypothetical protein